VRGPRDDDAEVGARKRQCDESVCLFVDVEVLVLVIVQVTSCRKRSQSEPVLRCAMTMATTRRHSTQGYKELKAYGRWRLALITLSGDGTTLTFQRQEKRFDSRRRRRGRKAKRSVWFTSSSCEARLFSGNNSVSIYLSSKTKQRKHRIWEVLTLPLFGDHGQLRGDRNIVILVVVPSWKGAHTHIESGVA
jgi:hypothetical protein